MASRRFAIRLASRLALLLLATGAAARAAVNDDTPMTTALALIVAGIAAISLWRLVTEVNRELIRFVTALERGDLGQAFRHEGRGAGFDRLAAAYATAIDRMRAERAIGAGTARYAEALVDGTPIAMLVLGPGETVRFANKAARRLFGLGEAATLAALGLFGRAFVDTLARIAPGRTASSHLVVDGASQRIALDATTIDIADGRRRVVSIRVIQQELDAAELAAQVDLVRVLTHEVMNSLTPVTSLAATAARLVDRFDPAWSPGVAKAQRAVTVLARRAGDLERFVESYRDFSASPTLHRAPVDVAAWFGELRGLFAATRAAAGVATAWSQEAGLGSIALDRGLMTQVMLNLFKNAGEAVAGRSDAAIAITASRHADRLRILVVDTGPGLDPAIANDVFLPFFTTKAAGTGIGLSFARKVVLLHGGRIGFVEGPGGRIELTLPIEAP